MDYGNRSEKEIFIAKAESCLDQGMLKESEDYALNCLEKYPDDAEARVILCQTWTRMGKLDKVKKLLEDVDEAIFGMSVIYAKMGDLCQRSGLNQEAITFYRKFLDLNPNSPLTRDVADKLHALAPVTEEILPPEEEAQCYSPPVLQTVSMAELYIKQGHTDLAAEILEKIILKEPANERALVLLNVITGGGVRAENGAPDAKNAPLRMDAKPSAVITELNRWLRNIDRIRSYAA